jgi:hypothetical protein
MKATWAILALSAATAAGLVVRARRRRTAPVAAPPPPAQPTTYMMADESGQLHPCSLADIETQLRTGLWEAVNTHPAPWTAEPEPLDGGWIVVDADGKVVGDASHEAAALALIAAGDQLRANVKQDRGLARGHIDD